MYVEQSTLNIEHQHTFVHILLPNRAKLYLGQAVGLSAWRPPLEESYFGFSTLENDLVSIYIYMYLQARVCMYVYIYIYHIYLRVRSGGLRRSGQSTEPQWFVQGADRFS